eukprot:TRINITY_DN428_c1_g1_i1.p1 TRINITY_DN428_c1_g1~~TRINITY_DN428_c1_g1_i1.p1  ORF type:complete len:566 (-),score=146.41 TRINITY_DN428_c1_g1_i1:243-1940(-)
MTSVVSTSSSLSSSSSSSLSSSSLSASSSSTNTNATPSSSSSSSSSSAPVQQQMTSLEVDSSEVIKIVLQFLKENGLMATARTLQDESQVTLNTVDDVEKFALDVLHGRWDAVLEVTSNLRLPSAKLIDLYEQIVLELAELRELDTARAILRTTPAMAILKKESPDRYLRLEHILQKTFFDYNEAYPQQTNKERRRQQIASALKKEVHVVPPSRLLALLSQSLKWQQYQGLLPKGSKFDLFSGTTAAETVEEEKVPTKLSKIINFGKKTHPECVRFSPDGQWLISGSVDGFVEVWDFDTGKLNKELKYQAEDDFMMHDGAVLSITWSRDSEFIATGSAKGEIKVWRIKTGQCVRKFPSAHTMAVTALDFARDGTQLVSASFDQTVRIHGLKSGKTLKEFRGHKSYVNSVLYSEDGNKIISGSADGTIKIWDTKTTDCIKTFYPGGDEKTTPSVLGLSRLYGHEDRFACCTRSHTIYILSLDGQIIQSFPSGANIDFMNFCVSPKGRFIYAVGEDNQVYCFDIEGSKLESSFKLHEKEVLCLAHHPHRNIFVSGSNDATLKLWRPQ